MLIIDQNLIVDTHLIEETGSSHPLIEMRNDVGDILHEDVLCLHVVEAQQSKILVN